MKFCPICGSTTTIYSTLIGVDLSRTIDPNTHRCSSCGFKWKAASLYPQEELGAVPPKGTCMHGVPPWAECGACKDDDSSSRS